MIVERNRAKIEKLNKILEAAAKALLLDMLKDITLKVGLDNFKNTKGNFQKLYVNLFSQYSLYIYIPNEIADIENPESKKIKAEIKAFIDYIKQFNNNHDSEIELYKSLKDKLSSLTLKYEVEKENNEELDFELVKYNLEKLIKCYFPSKLFFTVKTEIEKISYADEYNVISISISYRKLFCKTHKLVIKMTSEYLCENLFNDSIDKLFNNIYRMLFRKEILKRIYDYIDKNKLKMLAYFDEDESNFDESSSDGMLLVRGAVCLHSANFYYSPSDTLYVDDFYISKKEVTQKEWCEIMGDNPSFVKAPDNPVEMVSYNQVLEYCNKLSIKEGLKPCYNLSDGKCDFSASGYRLPKKYEMYFLMMSGRIYFPKFLDCSDIYKSNEYLDFAWTRYNSGMKTHPVAQKKANFLGLYDIFGNVSEYVYDDFDCNHKNKCYVLGGNVYSKGNIYLSVDKNYGYDYAGFRLAKSKTVL